MSKYSAYAIVTPTGSRSRKKLVDRLPTIPSGKSVTLAKVEFGRTNQNSDAAWLEFVCENDDPNRIPVDVRRAIRKAMGLAEVDILVMVAVEPA